MDFHSLSRKELQTLCKKNRIPANITNVAMADALSALSQVEGLDEFLNPAEAEAGEGTPETSHRTASRAATRRKALREEPQSAKVVSSQRHQRRTRGGTDEEGLAEQENKDANVVPITPATRRRATAVSTRRSKKEAEVVEDDEEKKVDHGKPNDVTETPAAVPRSRTRATCRSVCPKTNGTSVQQGNNTRRSVRLLEKNLSNMSLLEAEDTGPGKSDDVSEEMSISQQIEDSADTEEVCDAGDSSLTVSNVILEETDVVEVSCPEKKSDSECQVHLVSGKEIDVEAEAEVEAESKEEDSSLKADSESHDSSLELEGSSETHGVSNEVHDMSDVDMNNSIGVEAAQEDNNKAGSELLSESLEASEDASVEFAEQDIAALIVEVTDQDDASSLPMSPVSDDSAQLKEVHEVCGKNNEAEHLIVADDSNIQLCEPMKDVDDKAEDEKDLASLEGVLELGSPDTCYPSDEHQEEESEVKAENLEESLAEVEEMDSACDVIGTSSAIASEKDNANAISEDSIDVIDVCVESSADKSTNVESITLESPLPDDLQEELEAKSMGELENAISENSVGAMEVCTESVADVTNVTLEPSLVEDAEAEEEKDNLEAEAQPQESNEQAAEETTLESSGFNSHPLVESDAGTVAPIHELKATDIPMQSVQKDNMQNASMKENLTTDELHRKSMRELKMMLKKLSLDGKSNCKSKTNNNNNNNVVKEVERKRTALQALPENQMIKGAASSE